MGSVSVSVNQGLGIRKGKVEYQSAFGISMGSTLVYGDGVDDIKEFFTSSFSRGSRHSDGGSSVCTRPIILGSVLIIWLFCLSISLIVLGSKYQDLSVTHLSSRLDTVDSRHSDNHAKALKRIGQVDSHHR